MLNQTMLVGGAESRRIRKQEENGVKKQVQKDFTRQAAPQAQKKNLTKSPHTPRTADKEKCNGKKNRGSAIKNEKLTETANRCSAPTGRG